MGFYLKLGMRVAVEKLFGNVAGLFIGFSFYILIHNNSCFPNHFLFLLIRQVRKEIFKSGEVITFLRGVFQFAGAVIAPVGAIPSIDGAVRPQVEFHF
jgi:hypothetical protein